MRRSRFDGTTMWTPLERFLGALVTNAGMSVIGADEVARGFAQAPTRGDSGDAHAGLVSAHRGRVGVDSADPGRRAGRVPKKVKKPSVQRRCRAPPRPGAGQRLRLGGRGVLRGIDGPTRAAGTSKYVMCAGGPALDVIVSIRVGSPRDWQWTAEEMTGIAVRSTCQIDWSTGAAPGRRGGGS